MLKFNPFTSNFDLVNDAGGGASPAGTGTQLQYRGSSSTFAAITGSSVLADALILTKGFISAGTGADSVVVGDNATSPRSSSVAIGKDATVIAGFDAARDGGVAISRASHAEDGSVAIGFNTFALGGGVALGYSSSSTGSGLSIGFGAYTNSAGVAIGTAANCTGGAGLAMGYAAYAGGDSTALGRTANGQGNSVAIGAASKSTNNQFVAGSGDAGPAYQMRDIYFGSGYRCGNGWVADYTIHGSGADGTDTAGGSVTIAGGIGTGTGAGGDVIVMTAPAGSSGTGYNSLVEAFRVTGTTLKLKGSQFMANQSAAPATPSGGGVIYVEAGALKYKGSSGTITTLGPA